MSTTTSGAQRLKEEGNVLFRKKQFRAAIAKYSTAIELDGKNVVLFANRAACWLNLTRFIEAQADAKKATELDPSYAKGWARFATSDQELGYWEEAVESWRRAIDAFPENTELSAADKTQRAIYSQNLKQAQVILERQPAKLEPFRVSIRFDQGNLPWQRANELYPIGSSARRNSSAWVIMYAYEEWRRGLQGLSKMKKEKEFIQGEIRVIESLSNGILRDQRVFHLLQQDFSVRYNTQTAYEMAAHRADWTAWDSKTILQEATARLRSERWEMVRPALELTVRNIFMRAFLVYILRQDSIAAVASATTCIEVLEGGMKLWPNVADELVFCRSFTRAVKALRLEFYNGAYTKSPKTYPLDKLEVYANELLADAASDPPPPSDLDPGFVLSFWTYPKAEALATIGFCASENAEGCDTQEEAKPFWTWAGKFYEAAAKLFPEDDEKRGITLNAAIERYQFAKAPLSAILPLLVMMKESVPEMTKIWEHAATTAQGRDEMFAEQLQLEKELQRKLADGSISLSDPWEASLVSPSGSS